MLLDRGIHPLRIAEGYERACKVSIENLERIAHSFNFSESDMEPLVQTCMTTLSSKMCVMVMAVRPLGVLCTVHTRDATVFKLAQACSGLKLLHATCRVGRVKRDMAEMCVKAVLTVADLKRKDVNLDLIKVC